MNIGIDGRPLSNQHEGIGKCVAAFIKHLQLILQPPQTLNILSDKSPPPPFKAISYTSRSPFKPLNYKQIWSAALLPRLLKRLNIDLYHSFTNIDLPPRTKAKKVLTIHDIIPYLYPNSVSVPFSHSFSFFTKRMKSWSDHIISVSQSSKEDLINHLGYKEEQITVIPNGIDDHFTIPADYQGAIERVKSYFPYNPDSIYFVIFANPSPHKNIPFLLDVLSKINLPNVRYLFIGINKDKRSRLLDKIMQLRLDTNSHFISSLQEEDLPAVYSLSRALLLPSLYEGFGLPPLEAIASGCEALVMDTPTARELYPASTLKLSNSLDDWHSQISQLAQTTHNKDSMMFQSNWVKEHYTWNNNARDTLKVYRQLGLNID